jgi:hypothetical protein
MIEMTLTEALVQLKALNERIFDAIADGEFATSARQGDDMEHKQREMASRTQSITDMIRRRLNIKRAVIAANAATTVVVNGEEMTLAEAIELRSSIVYQRKLLLALKAQYAFAERDAQQLTDNAEHRLDSLLKDAAADEHGTIREQFMAKQKGVVVTCGGFDGLVRELSELVETVDTQLDATLSVANAHVTVEVAE